MKNTPLLCLMAMLTGCTAKQATLGMDSPIHITDGSTHLRHKGTNSDFQITNYARAEQVIVYDPGYTVKNGECKGVQSCPPSFTNNLVAPWTLDVFDGGNKIMTVSSADNATVVANFYAHYIDPEVDASGDTIGTDITQHDYTFKSAVFTNGGGGSPASIVCNSSPCKLKIHYKN